MKELCVEGTRRSCSCQHASVFQTPSRVMIVGQMWSLKRSSGAVIPLSFLYFRDNYSSLRVSISLCLFRGFPPTATYEWKLLQSQRRCLYFQRFTFKLNVHDYIPERATWRWVESELGCMWFVCAIRSGEENPRGLVRYGESHVHCRQLDEGRSPGRDV